MSIAAHLIFSAVVAFVSECFCIVCASKSLMQMQYQLSNVMLLEALCFLPVQCSCICLHAYTV